MVDCSYAERVTLGLYSQDGPIKGFVDYGEDDRRRAEKALREQSGDAQFTAEDARAVISAALKEMNKEALRGKLVMIKKAALKGADRIRTTDISPYEEEELRKLGYNVGEPTGSQRVIRW